MFEHHENYDRYIPDVMLKKHKKHEEYLNDVYAGMSHEEIYKSKLGTAGKQTEALVNRGAALLARAAADGGEQDVWQGHLDAGHRQLEALNARYAEAKNAEAEARRAYLGMK